MQEFASQIQTLRLGEELVPHHSKKRFCVTAEKNHSYIAFDHVSLDIKLTRWHRDIGMISMIQIRVCLSWLGLYLNVLI